MLAEFRARRDLIVEGLNELPGVDCITPQGAFYAFPRITETDYPAGELADLLLDEAGVACLSGTAFGRHGEGHLRLSYANSRENIALALERMGRCPVACSRVGRPVCFHRATERAGELFGAPARLDQAVGIYLRTTRVCATMSPRRLFFWEARTDMNATR